MSIPKKIFQTHITKDIPSASAYHIGRLRDINHDFEYQYYDDTDMDEYVKTHGSREVYNAFLKMKPGAGKADIWRLLIMHQEGGIYVDFDNILHEKPANTVGERGSYRPFRDILKSEDKFVHGNNWTIGGYDAPHPNLILCAEPRHPIIFNTLESVVTSVNNDIPIKSIGKYSGWGFMECYTGTPHLWQAIGDHIGMESIRKPGIYGDGVRITNDIIMCFKQHDEYGNDHVKMGGSHWSSYQKDIFNTSINFIVN
jgi:hypothetical protein